MFSSFESIIPADCTSSCHSARLLDKNTTAPDCWKPSATPWQWFNTWIFLLICTFWPAAMEIFDRSSSSSCVKSIFRSGLTYANNDVCAGTSPRVFKKRVRFISSFSTPGTCRHRHRIFYLHSNQASRIRDVFFNFNSLHKSHWILQLENEVALPIFKGLRNLNLYCIVGRETHWFAPIITLYVKEKESLKYCKKHCIIYPKGGAIEISIRHEF